jgi:enediyne polyketide synthase
VPADLIPVAVPAHATAAAIAAPAAGGGGGGPSGGTADGGPAASLDVLRRLAAERAELPVDAVRADSHPLDELHLSSISVGQIMNQAARELGVTAPLVTSNFATSTLEDLAQALDELAATELPGDADANRPPEGVAPWVRAFSIELVPQPQAGRPAGQSVGEWQVFATPGHPLGESLGRALAAAKVGDGVLLCLPADCGEQHAGLMVEAARAVLAHPGTCRFVTVQDQRGAAGLAKTMHLENPAVPVTVVVAPLEATGLALTEAIVADVAATTGFSEVHYDEAGTRQVPLLRPLTDLADGSEQSMPLQVGDVLLVTGGGKGITAECALALARDTGAAIGLLGRSDPAADAELAANLDRMRAAGVRYQYARADVTSPGEVGAAVAEISASLGPVTAVLHGAGLNKPVPLSGLDEAAFQRTLAPKIAGLDVVLTAVDPGSLKLLITFGSIIGRAGLRGQADYATANDWLTVATRDLAAAYPGCRCLALEWSVWAGAGMGERLGVLESLTRDGISPISVDDGIEILRQILASPQAPTAMVIMGRAGGLPTIRLEPRDLPLSRFIDEPRVYYPGVELVADVELSADSDPYLAEHLLDGQLLFPAVLGIEAMAQTASAVSPSGGTPTLEGVEFLRPIVVPVDGSTGIRIAALASGDRVAVAIRSADTGYQADHFRATLRYGGARPQDPDPQPVTDGTRVPLDPAADLYDGGILFQGRRFQRVRGYHRLAATSCVVEIEPGPTNGWFSTYFPGSLILGDPGSRDAFMHAIQCCVPNATLLPAAVERLYLADPAQAEPGSVILHARERHRVGDTFTYDLDIRTPGGQLLERWEGLRLQAVRKTDGSGPWVPALLGPFLERQLAELVPQNPRCAVEPDPVPYTGDKDVRRKQTNLAVSRVLGRPTAVRHRADGKPEVDADGIDVSASHGAGVTLAVAGPEHVGCDAETVRDRTPEDWGSLLGAEQFALAELIARERGEGFATAATRVWGAVECLRKTGRAIVGPVTLARSGPGAWVLLNSGQAHIATFPTRLRDETDPVVFTILTEGDTSGSLLRIPARCRV